MTLHNFLSTQAVARVKRGFYLRDLFIEPGSLGRVLAIVDNGRVLLVDFGRPPWIVARFDVTEDKLIEMVAIEEITKAERRRQSWRLLRYRLWRLRAFFGLARRRHMYDHRER